MKKVLVTTFLLIFSLCLLSCEKIIEYVSLSVITKDEEFTNAYVSSVNGDAQVLPVNFNDLKEKEFYKNIMNSSAKPTDVLPEVIPAYSLIISSDKKNLRIDDLGALFALYNDKWYLIKCSNEDSKALEDYLLGRGESNPNDPLQIIRNEEGKIVFSVIATKGDSCDIKYTDLNENKTIDAENKNEIFDYLVEILNGKESVHDYTNCGMDYSIEITYDIYNNPKEISSTYEFKFHSECGGMTILKNNELIGTVVLSSDEISALLDYIMMNDKVTFNELFGYTIDSAAHIIIDEGPGSIAPPWMHYVYEVIDDEKINLFLEYLNNTVFVKTIAMPGVGTKDITIKSDNKEFKLSFTNRDELWCNGQLYKSDVAFPELNERLIYQYYENFDNATINIFGQESELQNNYFEDIKFVPYSPKVNLFSATKFCIITLDGLSIVLTSPDTFIDSNGGSYIIVGDKDFSDLLEGVNTETARVLVKYGEGLSYTIIVSRNTEYTVEELKNALFGFIFEPYTLLKEDGSEFDSIIITEDITLLFYR